MMRGASSGPSKERMSIDDARRILGPSGRRGLAGTRAPAGTRALHVRHVLERDLA